MPIGYFNNFPKVFYDFSGNPAKVDYSILTNITTRIGFLKDIKNRADLYYPYTIQDTDTPENVANRYYGNPNYFWIVLLFNDIIDPQFDWPLSSLALDEKIKDKYGLSAINDPHHYELLVESYDITAHEITNFVYIIDETTYYATPESEQEFVTAPDDHELRITTTTAVVTNYDYEVLENEKKRKINILKKDYLGQVQEEFEKKLAQ